MHEVIGFYKENTDIIVETFNSFGFNVYGGKNAPYMWVHFSGWSSWDVFSEILENTHVVTTPGSGFGPAGEGFIRVSAFGHRNNILEACKRSSSYTNEATFIQLVSTTSFFGVEMDTGSCHHLLQFRHFLDVLHLGSLFVGWTIYFIGCRLCFIIINLKKMLV